MSFALLSMAFSCYFAISWRHKEQKGRVTSMLGLVLSYLLNILNDNICILGKKSRRVSAVVCAFFRIEHDSPACKKDLIVCNLPLRSFPKLITRSVILQSGPSLSFSRALSLSFKLFFALFSLLCYAPPPEC